MSYDGLIHDNCDGLIERIAALEAQVNVLQEAQDDYQGRLWCALGQPLDVEFIQAARDLKTEKDAIEAQNAELLRRLDHQSNSYVAGIDNLTRAREKAEAQVRQLREALDIISNHGVQYPWTECARIARAALAATEPKEGKLCPYSLHNHPDPCPWCAKHVNAAEPKP